MAATCRLAFTSGFKRRPERWQDHTARVIYKPRDDRIPRRYAGASAHCIGEFSSIADPDGRLYRFITASTGGGYQTTIW